MARTVKNPRTLTRRGVLGGAAVAVAVTAQRPAHAGTAGGDRPPQRSIDDAAAAVEEDLIALRRDLHARPEGPGRERRTAAAVAERLNDAGLAVTTGVGGHGVVGVLRGDRPGRTVAYRADMDAVPPADQIEGGGVAAHLCGHDLHTAVGVGVAQVLARLRHRLSGTVVFVFQPAEETLSGARSMLDEGMPELSDAAEIHALHCGPFPVGEFAVTPGTGLPGLDAGTVTVTGAGAAERAGDLAAEIAELGTVAPPQTPEDLERLVEQFHIPDGPLASSVYMRARAVESDAADSAAVELSYRCWPEDRHREVREEVDRIAASYGETEVDFPSDPFPAMVCPEWEGHELKRHLRAALGRDSVTVMQAAVPFSGEDFALFLDRMPGTFTYLGVRVPGADLDTSYPHFGTFDPDERAIGFGVRAMAGWLAERSGR